MPNFHNTLLLASKKWPSSSSARGKPPGQSHPEPKIGPDLQKNWEKGFFIAKISLVGGPRVPLKNDLHKKHLFECSALYVLYLAPHDLCEWL